MKQSQTLKIDPEILKELKKQARRMKIPFNRYAENIFKQHLATTKYSIAV